MGIDTRSLVVGIAAGATFALGTGAALGDYYTGSMGNGTVHAAALPYHKLTGQLINAFQAPQRNCVREYVVALGGTDTPQCESSGGASDHLNGKNSDRAQCYAYGNSTTGWGCLQDY